MYLPLTEMNGVDLKALMAAMGSAKEYTLKQYIPFAEKLQKKAEVKLFSSEKGHVLSKMHKSPKIIFFKVIYCW